jgi:ABC-type multidrug transport system ATPase subunit
MSDVIVNQEQRPVLSVAHVTKRYGSVKALDDVTFEIGASESVALWGPNGAGKTTILRCLLGLARYSGDISVNGVDRRERARAPGKTSATCRRISPSRR